MRYFFFLIIMGLLLVPFTTTTADAKATSSAPQVHVVKQGDNLYDIARRHGLTVNELKRLNGLNSNRLKLGQKLALNRAAAPPLPQASVKEPSRAKTAAQPTAAGPVHVVKKGDTLASIARRSGLSVDRLKTLNNLTNSRLSIGQRLALSEESGESTEIRSATPDHQTTKYTASRQHTVKKGDTLSGISRRHHVSVNELKRLNGLRGNNLKIGQRLALNDPYEERNPILLPGDANDDEVLDMAYSAGTELEQIAFNYLSTPYRFGGNSRKGIDCSAFVQQVFREVDVDLPRSAREQFRVGEAVERDDLQPGDLLFFRTYAKFPSHVGIYLGDGKMIHASSRSRRVVVTSIDFPYYRKRFIGAKRISLLDDEEMMASSAQLEAAAATADTMTTPAASSVESPVPASADRAAAIPQGTALTSAPTGSPVPALKNAGTLPAATAPVN